MTEPLPNPSRLRWLCRRGMKELDVLLERYLDERWPGAPAAERRTFAELLEREDPEIWAWVMGGAQPREAALADLIGYLRSAAANT